MVPLRLLGLPFVPLADVQDVFDDLLENDDDMPGDLVPIYESIETTYITGIRARGRRRAVPPPAVWNACEADLYDE